MSQKNTLIKGTFILTIAGLLSRILGFYNRIFLSRFIGAKELGIYQLIFPVYMLCYSICCQGIQTAISKMVAAYSAQNNKTTLKRILRIAIVISVMLSFAIGVLIFLLSDFVSIYILKELDCSLCLKITSIAMPFVAIKSCIIGYELGLKKSFLPASCQLVEQVLRVGSIYIVSVTYFLNKPAYASIAVAGMVFGEVGSCFYMMICYFFANLKKTASKGTPVRKRILARQLVHDSVLLTSNRLALTLLQSLEAILIPSMLILYYGSRDTSLELYGILTGMVLPFIFFPSAITNSLSVMLLPTISSAKERKQTKMIHKTISSSVHYCIVIGIVSAFLFLFFGKPLGNLVFHDALAGELLFMLAILCPFIYVTSALSSIQNGLGKVNRTLFHNMIALGIRILFILFAIPHFGIKGYLWGELVSYLLLIVLDLFSIIKETTFDFNAYMSIVKPILLSVISGGIALVMFKNVDSLWELMLQCAVYGGIFFVGMVLFLMPDRKQIL